MLILVISRNPELSAGDFDLGLIGVVRKTIRQGFHVLVISIAEALMLRRDHGDWHRRLSLTHTLLLLGDDLISQIHIVHDL